MRSVVVFVLVQLLAILAASAVAHQPYIEEFRPSVISEIPNAWDIASILGYVVAGTIVLLVLRRLGFRLKYFLDLTIFISCYYLAAIVSYNEIVALVAGLVGLAARQISNITIYNIVSGVTVVAFCLIFGLFLNPALIAILLGLMSLYDVVGVFYTRHIKYIWFGKVEFNPLWRNTLAFVFPTGMKKTPVSLVGAGDFALPTLMTVSMTLQNPLAGVILLIAASIGFFALQKFAEFSSKTRETGVPGIPILAFFSIAGLILAKSLGLAG